MRTKISFLGFNLLLCLTLSLAMLQTPTTCYGDDDITIKIRIAPKTLNLRSQGEWVTVHTNIAYSKVDAETVTLNEIPISWSKADNKGNFVGKFAMNEIKDLVCGEELEYPVRYEFTLEGSTTDDDVDFFSGTKTIRVINIKRACNSGQ